MGVSQDRGSNECISFQIRRFAAKTWLIVDLFLSNVYI